ncbi:MAG TPA: TonB-dependent receptor [Novosphingobium sp.]|nr:TonB-dependent receptor [Novosphingobium sp.]
MVSFAFPSELAAQSQDSVQPLEIIVTGERQRRSLFDTPSSVAVLTADTIEAQAATDRADQLLAFVPNIQLGSGGDGPTIRGQDSTGVLRDISAFLGGTRPRATLQADGRALSYYEYVFGTTSTWDVAQVEVFRSPQTTTQGRNSIAGAIFLRTADPTEAWEARGRVVAGNFGTRQASATLSAPLINGQLAMRVSGDVRRMRNSSDMADGIVGARLDHDDFGVGRIKLRAKPEALPGLKVDLIYVHGRNQAPQFEAVFAPFEARRAPTPERTNGVYRINSDSLTLTSDYEVARRLGWRTTLSWGDVQVQRFGLPGLGRTRIGSRDFAVESILSWQRGVALEALGGVHWLTQRQRQTIDVTGLGLGTGDFADRQTSHSFFGQATWRPLPRFAVTGGVRYQHDLQDRDGVLRRPTTPVQLDYRGSFDAWLPKLSVALDFDDDLTAGLVIQRAFNPGGVTLTPFSGAPDEFGAETLWSYEAFARARFSGGRATLRANLFYNDMADAQRPRQFLFRPPVGAPLVTTDIINASAAESYGGELELGWRPHRHLSLNLGAALLRTRIKRMPTPSDPLLGTNFQRAPHFSASAGVDWSPNDELRLSAQFRANSGYFSDDANTPTLRIGGSTVVNARAAYTRGGLTVFGYARNLFNSFHVTYLFTPTLGAAADPREVGVGVELRF